MAGDIITFSYTLINMKLLNNDSNDNARHLYECN